MCFHTFRELSWHLNSLFNSPQLRMASANQDPGPFGLPWWELEHAVIKCLVTREQALAFIHSFIRFLCLLGTVPWACARLMGQQSSKLRTHHCVPGSWLHFNSFVLSTWAFDSFIFLSHPSSSAFREANVFCCQSRNKNPVKWVC